MKMLNKTDKKKTFNKLKAKYRTNFWATIIVFIAIIIAFNVVISVLVDKFPMKLDLTANGQFEFSEQSKTILKNLKDKITIYVVGTKTSINNSLAETIDRYDTNSHNVTVKYIDPSTNPTFGKKYVSDGETLSTGTIIITNGDRFKKYALSDMYVISTDDSGNQTISGSQAEQKITSAIDYVTSDDHFEIYFADGNGEESITQLSAKFKNENYTVSTVNLLTKELDPNAKLLVLFAPTRDYTTDEITKLDKFMDNGGQLQVYLPPATDDKFVNLKSFLKEWGLDFNDDFVVENTNNMAQVGQNIVSLPNYVTHDITKNLISSKLYTAYKSARSIKVLVNQTSGITTSELLQSSKEAYARTDYRTNTDLYTKSKTDTSGPFTIAAVASKPNYDKNVVSRVFLVGSDLMLNDTDMKLVDQYPSLANVEFAVNAANWMQNKEDNVSIRTKSLDYETIVLDNTNARILMGIAISLPIIVLIVGFIIWFKRRHL